MAVKCCRRSSLHLAVKHPAGHHRHASIWCGRAGGPGAAGRALPGRGLGRGARRARAPPSPGGAPPAPGAGAGAARVSRPTLAAGGGGGGSSSTRARTRRRSSARGVPASCSMRALGSRCSSSSRISSPAASAPLTAGPLAASSPPASASTASRGSSPSVRLRRSCLRGRLSASRSMKVFRTCSGPASPYGSPRTGRGSRWGPKPAGTSPGALCSAPRPPPWLRLPSCP